MDQDKKKEFESEEAKPQEQFEESSEVKEETPKSKDEEASKEENNKSKKKVKKSKEEVLIESLQAQVQKLEEQRKKDLEDYLKARADLENTKKRLTNDSIEQRKYASQGLVEKLVQPVDMLQKVSSMEAQTPEMQNFLIGFKMIADQLQEILKSDGLSEIEALNKPFDPNFHQAISKEKKDGVEPGMVIEVLQTGYKYKDHILKPSMVKVSE